MISFLDEVTISSRTFSPGLGQPSLVAIIILVTTERLFSSRPGFIDVMVALVNARLFSLFEMV